SWILAIAAGSTVSLSGLTFTGGKVSSGLGGAIYNGGTLMMSNCTIEDSQANVGGGVFNDHGTLAMVNCTVSGNSAAQGGGVCNSYGTLKMANCTVYGNTAQFYGGGIDNFGTLTLDDCTVAGNSAHSGDGGGLATGSHVGSATATLNNTIIANSTSGGDIAGTVSGSNNLIDDAATAGGLMPGANGNLVGVPALLGQLDFIGGPTKTLPLLTGSPAIKAGNPFLIPNFDATDQRGAPRIKNGAVDIGAIESGPATIEVTTFADQDTGTINPW